MNFFSHIVWTILSVHLASAQPLLKELPTPDETRLPIDRAQTQIDCDQIFDRLTKYNQMAREHDQSVTAFLFEVTQKLTDWHTLLQPLECPAGAPAPSCTAQVIPAQTFDPLADGANKIGLIAGKAADNSELLALEMDRILTAYQDCHGSKNPAHLKSKP